MRTKWLGLQESGGEGGIRKMGSGLIVCCCPKSGYTRLALSFAV